MAENKLSQEAITGMKTFAKYIAIVVRKAMEDFHWKHLSDMQMKELNPIIRNAIYSAIYAYETQKHSGLSMQFVDYHFMSIPKFWEEPELLGGLRE